MIMSRDPAWSWLAAVDRANSSGRLPRRLDARMREAVRFGRELHRCKDGAAQRRLAKRRPAFVAAHALYAPEPPGPRWELEARLLTDDPFEQVALDMGMSAEAVATYHDLFFDVRD